MSPKNKGKKVSGRSKKQDKAFNRQSEENRNRPDVKNVTESVGRGEVSIPPLTDAPSTSFQEADTQDDDSNMPKIETLKFQVERCEIISTAGTSFSFPGTSLVEPGGQLHVEILINDMEKCLISGPQEPAQPVVTFHDTKYDRDFLSKWPRVKKTKVPAIFLHKPIDFVDHVKEIIALGIHFYRPKLKDEYTKIICQTLDDHKSLVKYFDKKNMPYHTFSHPAKRWIKVVIRGLSEDVNLMKLRSDLKAVSIPIKRVHRMHIKESHKSNKTFVLAVIPRKPEAMKLLRVKSIMGHEVEIEPPLSKSKQCHRCQKWGHNQRFCRGEERCVKCAGNHISSQCTRDRKTEPPKCANCGGGHTASYRRCPFCPDSRVYKLTKMIKEEIRKFDSEKKPHSVLVTFENYGKLYENFDYNDPVESKKL